MPDISSTSSQRNWPRWSQWLVVGVCLSLGAIYLFAPQRPISAILQGAAGWLIGMPAQFSSTSSLNFLPNSDLAQDAKPLASFGGVAFLGCDLSAESGQFFLVTNWQFPQPRPNLNVVLRLILPLSGQPIESQRSLDNATIESSLPDAFFERGQRGQVWLMVTEPKTGQLVAAEQSVVKPNDDGWLRICR
jgi:hypothetical protein